MSDEDSTKSEVLLDESLTSSDFTSNELLEPSELVSLNEASSVIASMRVEPFRLTL